MLLITSVLKKVGGNNFKASTEHAKMPPPPEQLLMRSLQAILKHEHLEKKHAVKLLATARTALDSLPLATVEYSQAAAALENAFSYIQAGVTGAAHYELRTLFRKMQSTLEHG